MPTRLISSSTKPINIQSQNIQNWFSKYFLLTYWLVICGLIVAIWGYMIYMRE